MKRDWRNPYRVEALRAGYVEHQDLVASPGLRSVPVSELSYYSLPPIKYTKTAILIWAWIYGKLQWRIQFIGGSMGKDKILISIQK